MVRQMLESRGYVRSGLRVILHLAPDSEVISAALAVRVGFEQARTGLYFRLNICGMGTAREIMSALDMMADAPFPNWPTLEGFNLSDYPDKPEYHPEGPKRDAVHAALTRQL